MISSVSSSQPRPPSKGVLLETQVCKALLTGFQARTGGSLGEGLAMSPVLRGWGKGEEGMELWHSWPFPATLGVPEKAWIRSEEPWLVSASIRAKGGLHFLFLGWGAQHCMWQQQNPAHLPAAVSMVSVWGTFIPLLPPPLHPLPPSVIPTPLPFQAPSSSLRTPLPLFLPKMLLFI